MLEPLKKHILLWKLSTHMEVKTVDTHVLQQRKLKHVKLIIVISKKFP